MPETLVVRPMRAEDIDGSLEALEAVATEERWVGTHPGFDRAQRGAAWLAWIDDPFVRQFVIVDPASGRIMGSGQSHRERYGVAELGMSLVPGARGRGAGGALLDVLIDASRDLRAHKAALQVWPHNEPAIRLYLSRGFVVEGRIRRHYKRPNGEPWDAILMGLLLDDAFLDMEPTLSDGSVLADASCLPATIAITP